MHEYSKIYKFWIFSWIFNFLNIHLVEKYLKTSWIFKIFMNIHDIQVGTIPRWPLGCCAVMLWSTVWVMNKKSEKEPSKLILIQSIIRNKTFNFGKAVFCFFVFWPLSKSLSHPKRWFKSCSQAELALATVL